MVMHLLLILRQFLKIWIVCGYAFAVDFEAVS